MKQMNDGGNVAVNLKISKQWLVNKSDQWKDGWMDKLDGSRSEWLIELMMKWMNACCSMHGDRRNVQLTKDAWTIDRSNERHDRRHRQRHTRPTATLSVVVLCGFRTRFTSSRLYLSEWMESATNSCQLRKQAWRTKWASSQLCNLLATASFGSNGKQAKKRCGHCNASKHFQLMQLCAKCQE